MSETACDCDLHPATYTQTGDGGGLGLVRIAIGGMHCPACADRVRAALLSTSGVSEAIVALATGVASVRYHPHRVTERELLLTVSRAGQGTRHRYRGSNLF